MRKSLLGFMVLLALNACAVPVETKSTSAVACRDTRCGGQQGPGMIVDGPVADADTVFFAYDSHALTQQARTMLDRHITRLKYLSSYKVRIEGHADERGTREYNLALGERRAEAVKAYLANGGIEANRMTMVSYGKERPLALGSDENAWSRNRRAVVLPVH